MSEENKKSWVDELLSPEGIIVLLWASMLDFLGLVDFAPVVGWIVSFGVAVVGFLTLSVWAFFKTRGNFWYRFVKIIIRSGIVFLLEALPFVSILPGWIILVLVTYIGKDIGRGHNTDVDVDDLSYENSNHIQGYIERQKTQQDL